MPKIKKFTDDNSEFENDEGWPSWKFLGDNDNEKIYLSDFSSEGTFKLISPEYRQTMIKRLVKEIECFIKKVQKY